MHPFTVKYLVYYALVLAGLGLLFTRKSKTWSRNLILLASFFVLGGVLVGLVPSLDRALGMHPSPMCSLTRLFQMAILKGFFPKVLIVSLSVILILSLVGKKLFCGWACPLGALQEMVYSIPWIKKVPNLPFRLTNWVRTYLFIAFLLGLAIYGVYLYGGINAFELLHWELNYFEVSLGVGLLLLVSLFYYRPYCYLVCPIGLASWLLERFSMIGVRFRQDLCTSCHACVSVSPCPAIEPLIEGKKGWIADCTSCGLCLESCPEKALTFGLK